ncbi:methyl-accepting chemotaxis protein [Hyalangium rubrum]|uniref:Methyl-accepting chemotaxis protein n=1 Tax=Hyalangium rubrum TaxID=3103134 RepID=A0ABU5HG51_9BACT|nr:methyl-accepting chemotaxis protein [Hyalangium sp. s54d21]MDY7231793.1 methyl-accepting chemotaxis protein [Hyalangium sp. s54d21]
MRLSLSRKLGLTTLGTAVLLVALSFGYLLPEVEWALESQARIQGQKTAASLASTLAELASTRQQAALQRALDEVVTSLQPAYILIVDPSGELIASAGALAPRMADSQKLLGRSQEARALQLEGRDVFNVPASIRGGSGGTLHMGFNLSVARTGYRSISLKFGLVISLSVLAFSLTNALLSRRIVSPLVRLTEAARRIAEHGDLREQVRVDSGDEVGQLSSAFASMVGRLKDVLHQLQSSSALLADAVRTLNTSAEAQSQAANRHVNALRETQGVAREIRETSLLASQTAESVLQVAERADTLGQTGEAAIAQSIEGLMELRAEVQQIATQIASLNTRTQQIGGITQTVKGLADQSNMLAVNAAIESVRSGEHGKGFGVVAREIRGLADQSIRATSQVRELLTDISDAIAATVRIIEQGTQRMESGLAQTRKSGDNMRALSTIVRDSSASVRHIAQTVNQQTYGIEQIFSAMSELNTLMDASVAHLTVTQDKVAALERLSAHVTRVLKDYRV